MNKPPSEPEGGHSKTTIVALSRAEKPAKVILKHNGIEKSTDKEGKVISRINGGEVYLHGITITKKVTKGVENVFRFNTQTGGYDRVILNPTTGKYDKLRLNPTTGKYDKLRLNPTTGKYDIVIDE